MVALRSFPRRWRAAVAGFEDDESDESIVFRRPDPATWSAIEYAAHVRGVFELYRARIQRALRHDGEAVAESHLDDDPWEGHSPTDALDVVLEGLDAAARALADDVERVANTDWGRTVVLAESGPRDVLWMARAAVHEGSHHLRDVERVLERARAV